MPFKNMPDACFKLWEQVYNASKKAGDDEEKSAKKAYGAIKQAGWSKDAKGEWHKSDITEFSMRIERASYDKATNERRWRAVASDTDEDKRKDSMSLQLFNDFISRIDTGELVPEQYQSDFWKGGMPYVSVSHYSDLNGDGIPGVIDAVYIDGTYLKAKGRFNDNPLGRKCFEAICADLYNKENGQDKKVRVSIGFLDWSHQHKSDGFIFNRKGESDICPECLKDLLTGEDEGKVFLIGHLVHLALTRVPANERTSMEVEKTMADEILTRKDDATSIVGEELATELDEKSKKLREHASLVTFSEVPEPGDSATDAVVEEAAVRCPSCNQMVTPTSAGMCPKCGAQFPASEDTGGIETESKAKDKTKAEEDAEAKLDAEEEEGCGDRKKKKSDLDEIMSEISELKSLIVSYNSHPSHPLDVMFETFKSDFDEVTNSDVDVDTKLRSIQEPFNKLGSDIVTTIRTSIVVQSEPEDAIENDMATMIARAIAKAVSPLSQKLEILSNQMQPVSSEKKIPERRSIQAAEVRQSVINQQTETPDSPTPKLRALVRKTVG
jgi:hypothetical protein